MEAADEATAVMSRLQVLETRSTGAMTRVAQRFRGKEATDYKLQTWSEKGSESFTAFKMELQIWVGSLHVKMVKVMDVAEAEEGRLMEFWTSGMQECHKKRWMTSKKWTEKVTGAHFIHKRRTTYANLKERDSKRGNKGSVTSIRGRVQTGLLLTPE